MNPNPPPKQLKELPQSPKKGKIYEMYGKQYSINTMKINLDGIIEEYKKITKKHVSPREVPQPVWIEWLKNFGFPEHYQTDYELAERKTIFDKP
jgi:hypothetical protein